MPRTMACGTTALWLSNGSNEAQPTVRNAHTAVRRALVRADCKVADGDTTAMHLIIKSQIAKAESAPPVPTPRRLSDGA